MSSSDPLNRLLEGGLVAILRADRSDELVDVSRAIARGGIQAIEVTCTTPGALDLLPILRKELGRDALLGAGTVLDPETARLAILAGAQFIVAPSTNLDTIRLCRRYSVPIMPGAYTPTEIVTAWEAGADVVKLFPADLGGPAYLKAIRGPLPHVRILPTGGVNLQTLPEFVRAGACAVGLGGNLVDKVAVARGDFGVVEATARQYVDLLRTTREGMKT